MRPSGKETKSQLPADVRKVFTDAATRFPRDFANQAQHIVAAHRPAGLPERFQPTMNFSDWDRINREKQRQRQDAIARELAEKQQAEQQRLASQRAEQQREEQRKIREAERGEETCRRLDQEMRSTPLPHIAEQIRQQWQAQSPNVPITLTPFREPRVRIYSDDEIRDESKVGIRVFYSHEEFISYEGSGHYEGEGYVTDYSGFTGVQTVTGGLDIGIGIGFTNIQIIPEARKSEYFKGVKAYFIFGTAVPVEYPNSLQKFYELIADKAIERAPSTVIPEANQRIQEYRKDHPEPKKGWWRRLIDG